MTETEHDPSQPSSHPPSPSPGQSAPLSATTPVAQLDDLSRLFGSFAALRRIQYTFLPGKCYVLLGENGAGKSTLLRILAGLLPPSHGTITLFGSFTPAQACGRIGYMSHAPMLYDELTGVENLAYFAALYPRSQTLAPELALQQVGLDPALPRKVGQYSQGMRQRASLARVLMAQPELLLLDEPFSNMDIQSAHQMVALLDKLRQPGRTVVLTTHQRELALPIADCMLTLHAGQIASEGSAHRP